MLRGRFPIDPGCIEAALQARPEVQAAAVVVIDPESETPRLMAALVRRSGEDADLDAIRAALAAECPGAVLPVAYRWLDQLPHTPDGEVDRRALASLLTGPVGSGTPRTPLEQELHSVWQTVLDRQDIGIHDHFFATLGGDSMMAVRLLVDVEQRLQRRVPPTALFRLATIADMARAIATAPPSPPHPGVVELQPQGTRPALFFAPSIGGGLGNLRNLTRYLDADQPVFGLREQNKGPPWPYARSLEALAEECVAALRSVQPVGPYYLAGFSFGGWVAAAMAGQLEQQGQAVALLAILDASARWFRQPGPRQQIYNPDDRRATYRFLAERYVPAPYTGDILYVQATQRWEAALLEPDGGWGAATTGRVQVQSVEGSHTDLVKEPGVRTTAKILNAALHAAQSHPPTHPLPHQDASARLRFLAKQAEIDGRLDQEIRYYQQALAVHPDQPLHVLTNLWEALHAAGRPAEGRVMYEQAAERFAEAIPFHYRAALLWLRFGQLALCEQHLHRALALGCRSPALWFVWGQLEQRRGHLDAAIGRFRQTLAAAPDHPGALRHLANLSAP